MSSVELSPEGVEHRFVEANGLRFHVACAGSGDRLALLLHGFPECWYSWRYQLPLLARLGYRAWAPDLRGYGESDRPRELGDYAIEALVEDVGGLIDAAAPRETVLIGHDWGAVIAWFAAIRRIRPLDRLVIMNVPHPGVDLRSGGLRQLFRSWYILFFQLPWLPELLLRAGNYQMVADAFQRMAVNKHRFPEHVLDVYRQSAARPGALTAMVHYYRALVRGGGMLRQRRLGYPAIETPTLMLWGERDAALGKELTYGTADLVRELTLRYLPDASHWVQQDDPDRVNAMLDAWLEGRPVPEAWEL